MITSASSFRLFMLIFSRVAVVVCFFLDTWDSPGFNKDNSKAAPGDETQVSIPVPPKVKQETIKGRKENRFQNLLKHSRSAVQLTTIAI